MRVHEFKFRQTWYKPMSKLLPVMFFCTQNPQCDIFQSNSDLIFVLKWRTYFEITKYRVFRIYNRVTDDGSSPVVHLNKLPPYVSIAPVFSCLTSARGKKSQNMLVNKHTIWFLSLMQSVWSKRTLQHRTSIFTNFPLRWLIFKFLFFHHQELPYMLRYTVHYFCYRSYEGY